MTAHLPDVGRLPAAVLRPATANVFETTVEQLATAAPAELPRTETCPRL